MMTKQEAINILWHKRNLSIDTREAIEMAIKALKQEPIKATWEGVEYDGYADGCPVYDVWECTQCGYEHHGESDTLTDYCPGCGAKMTESEE